MNDLGSFIKLWEADGGGLCVEAHEAPRLDAAVTEFLHSGHDSLLQLTLIGGDPYWTLASNITSWRISSPAGREHEREIARLQSAENGTPWESSD